MPEALTYLPFFVIAAVAVAVIAASHRQTTLQNRFFEGLSDLGAAGQGACRVLRSGNHEFHTAYSAGSRNSPSRFELTTGVQAPGGFTVEREGASDQFFEGLGLEGKIATPDPDFDKRFHIVSDDDAFAGSYFSSEKKRRAVLALFGLGCARVELGSAGLKAAWSPFSLDGASADFVREALPELAVLAEELPLGLPFPTHGGPSQKSFTFLVIAGWALFALGMIGLPSAAGALGYRPLSGEEVLWASLRVSGSALAVYLAAVALALKGRSWFLKGLLQAFFAGVATFPLYGYWGFVWANCALDWGPPAAHAALVVDTYVTTGKHATYYHARLRSWRPDHDSESLPVSYGVYAGLVPGRSTAVVETRPGRLGFEWVTRYGFK